jgi:hypothetical protein
MSRLTVSEEVEEDRKIATVITTVIMPKNRIFLFIIENRRNWLKKLIPNYEKTFV